MAAPDLKQSAAELGRKIASGKLDPVELAEAYFDAIDGHRHSGDIYARTTPDRARTEAQAARARQQGNGLLGPLDGVPISWKDLFDTEGTATEAGCAMLKGRVPQRDATVLTNAARAGLVCLGKTHMTELAFSGLGVNPVTATPPNRHDPHLAPGGSSSGAAASVGYGLAAAGIGSDTGGSVRVPAAWNDLVGFKTSAGDLPLTGVVPLCAKFDTIGPLCRTVEDAHLLYAALAGQSAEPLGKTSLDGKKLLVLDAASLPPLDTAPIVAFEGALSKLSAAGAIIEHRHCPSVDAAMPLSGVLYTTEAYATWQDEIEAKGDLMNPLIRARFAAGLDHSGVAYVRAWQTLESLRQQWRSETDGFDAVVMPSVAILPPRTADLLADADYFMDRNLATLRNTRVGNLMGLSAVTLPTGVQHCGLMVMIPPGQDGKLLAIAAAMEKTLNPPI